MVTSDWAEQQIVLGSGGIRVLPRELKIEYNQMRSKIKKRARKTTQSRMVLGDRIDDKVLEILEKWRKDKG
ncbi:NYN domain-containing protein [Maledivibacter halophilus]|uniref:Predicted RNA-binding protein containing a PIN domain n=1 Tax=Maledivibacter halophilus TaxID=36842 RepID=A0A1T5MI44_9FIRM|nr:NYN domain-containing protein [Maledivibacter halophilus]SKC87588.1 Predicted RNA-binding protein containing a PIN domain [Maledivibacter halophilus]